MVKQINTIIICLKPHLFMVRFSVSLASEGFPFYSYVYILHNYDITLKCNFIVVRDLLVSLTYFTKRSDTLLILTF